MKRFCCLFIVLMLFAAGCRSVVSERNYQEWTPSDITATLAGNDPIEPFNRAMFWTGDVLMDYVVRPVSWVYASILPREAVARIYYVSENLAFPGRMVSCFCQLKFKNGGIVLCRFLVNSTVGIGGLFDPADAWLGMTPRYENMGHAFACWGIPPGCLLVLPVNGATNVRDQVGYLFDTALDVKFILPYAQSASFLNRAVYFHDSYKLMTETASDSYEQMKLALLMQHLAQSGNHMENPIFFKEEAKAGKAKLEQTSYVKKISPKYHPQTPAIDSLKFTLFQLQNGRKSLWLKQSLWNKDFDRLGEDRSVKLMPGRPELPYHFWKGSGKELVFLLPGVGGHHKSVQLCAMAELLYQKGFSVAVLPSAFNPVFANASGTMLPGYSPEDAQNLRQAMLLILKDLKTKREPFVPETVSLGGYSLGGVHALHVAELERRDPKLHLRRIVALNPPVDLSYAIASFERLEACSKNYTQKEFLNLAGDAAGKYIAFLNKAMNDFRSKKQTPVEMFQFSDDQASVMAGVSFRLSLRELLENAKHYDPAAVGQLKVPWSWWRRTALYREIDKVNGSSYIQNFVLPLQLKKHPGAKKEDLYKQAGLRSLANLLYEDPRIRVLHNADDPLLSDDDRSFLSRSLGKRLLWFDCGGHLGNLYMPDHQKELLKAFEK